jgi:phosphoserine aminotransferase
MKRIGNFNAGPAALPLEVLQQAQEELLDFRDSGMSIMEHSHRGKVYEKVHFEAMDLLRELADIPPNYKILFLQGGASLQFTMVPMNLLPPEQSADYILTGHWSERAVQEAKLLGNAHIAGSSKDESFSCIPKQENLDLHPEAAYVHYTSNNTIYGTQWHWLPETGNIPLIADTSSDILSRRIQVGRYGLIYGGAQKNLGPSGVTVVILREDVLAGCRKDIPTMLSYATHAKADSLYNTPPTFAVYILGLVLQWIKKQGGLAAIEEINYKKAQKLYAVIDRSGGYYRSTVNVDSRSQMNVTFRLATVELEEKFISEASQAGFVGLKGHRAVGGVRASLYNAVSLETVRQLTNFMSEFKSTNS